MKTPREMTFAITGLGLGGAEKMLLKLITQYRLKKDLKINIIVINPQKNLEKELLAQKVHIYYLRGQFLNLNQWKQIFICCQNSDLFIGWMYHGNLVAFILAFLFRKNFIQNIRQSLSTYHKSKWRSRFVMRLDAFASKFAKNIIYNSSMAKIQHQEILGYSTQHSQVIPNGFLIPEKSPLDLKTEYRHQFNLPTHELVILNVARFHPDKDHQTFITAAVGYLKKFPNTHFVLVGSNMTIENSNLTDLIPKTILSRFHFLGERQDLNRIFPIADIFTLTSKAEAFPNVLGEAMSYGLYPISTDVGDAKVILGPFGRVVDVSDTQAICQAWEDYQKKSKDEKDLLPIQIRESIRERFEISTIADQYLEAFYLEKET